MKGICSDNKSRSRKIGSVGNDDVWMRTLDIMVIEEKEKKGEEEDDERKYKKKKKRKRSE
jgi:hypothetical protein